MTNIMKAKPTLVAADYPVKPDARVKVAAQPVKREQAEKLVAEIVSINRKRTALDEALRRRQIALARLDASPVAHDVPRCGLTSHVQ